MRVNISKKVKILLFFISILFIFQTLKLKKNNTNEPIKDKVWKKLSGKSKNEKVNIDKISLKHKTTKIKKVVDKNQPAIKINR